MTRNVLVRPSAVARGLWFPYDGHDCRLSGWLESFGIHGNARDIEGEMSQEAGVHLSYEFLK